MTVCEVVFPTRCLMVIYYYYISAVMLMGRHDTCIMFIHVCSLKCQVRFCPGSILFYRLHLSRGVIWLYVGVRDV